ncbi:MAG: hypothetical protein ACRDGR_02280 [bacterium]
MRSASRAAALLLASALWLAFVPAASAKLFDEYELSARARAHGGSYAGLSGDAAGVYYNPAGLVNLSGLDVQASLFEPWGADFMQVNQIAIARPAGRWGTFGIGYSDFKVRYQDVTLSVERTVTLAHGFTAMEDLSSSLSVGWALNLYNLDYPTPSVSGYDLGSETTFGLDLGVFTSLHERTTAGVYFTNVNNPEMGDPVARDLPQGARGGVAYRPYDGVVTAFEIGKQLGEEIRYFGGMEFQVAEPLALRFGAQSKPNLLNVGVGLHYANLTLDVAYTHHPVLDPTLHYGLALRF